MASYSEYKVIGSLNDVHPPIKDTRLKHLPEDFFRTYKYKFLPEYDHSLITSSPKREAFLDATLKVFEFLHNSVTDMKDIFGVKFSPETLLKYHSQLLGFEQIDFSFNFTTYRDLVMNLVNIYKIKGTKLSYDIFFQSIGYNVKFINFWYNSNGDLVRTRPPGAPNRLYDNYHNNRSNIIRVVLEPIIQSGIIPEVSVDAEFITIITTYLKFLKPAHIIQEAVEIVVPPLGGDIIVPIESPLITVPVASISVTSSSGLYTITVDGGTLQMLATILPVNATNQNLTWQIFPGTGVATVDQTGVVTAWQNGTVTVRATANDGSGVFGQAALTLSNQTASLILVTNISVSVSGGGSAAITSNEGTLQLLYSILPVNATIQQVNWSVINVTGEATVDQSGLVTAAGGDAANGTVIVRATAIDGSGIYGELEVVISNQVDIPDPIDPDPNDLYDNFPGADLVNPPTDQGGQYVYNPIYGLYIFVPGDTSNFVPALLFDENLRSTPSSGGVIYAYPAASTVLTTVNNRILIVINGNESKLITFPVGTYTVTDLVSYINSEFGRTIATQTTTASGQPVIKLTGKTALNEPASIQTQTTTNPAYTMLNMPIEMKYVQGVYQNLYGLEQPNGEDYVKIFDTLTLSALALVQQEDTFHIKIGRGFRIGGEYIRMATVNDMEIPVEVSVGEMPTIGGHLTASDTLKITVIATIELEDTLDNLTVGNMGLNIGGGADIGGTGGITDELEITDSEFILAQAPGDIGAVIDVDALD